jgi:hypothetical protein
VRYIVVELSAALLEGATVATQDIVEGVRMKVLPLERVLASKRAANRPKDQAQIPALEAALAARAQSRG